jgi:manganese efflux pump family protein
MPLAPLLALAVAVGANNFAAALGLGALGQARHWPRIALVFGTMEFAVALGGIWLGRQAAMWLDALAGWLGPALLIAVGLWVASAPWRGVGRARREAAALTNWPGLLGLAAGLSIDNVVVGFSLGLGGADAWLAASIIGVAAMVFAIAGVRLGRASRGAWETPATVAAGAIMIAVGWAVALGAL